MNQKEMAEIRRKLGKNLSNDRYQHTLGVAYMVVALAMRHQASIEDAELVELLYDCARECDKKESLSITGKSGIRFSAADMATPQIRHAITDPAVAERRYGVARPGIPFAIYWHTAGRREMPLLEKIVFTADYTEPNRDRVDNLAEMRYLAFQGLDFYVYRITADTLRYLASKQTRADQKTEERYQWLKEVKKYDDK